MQTMTGRQFTAAMTALGYSAAQMAVALGMKGGRNDAGPRNVRNWRRHGLPSTAAGKALAEKIRRMLEGPREPYQLATPAAEAHLRAAGLRPPYRRRRSPHERSSA